MTMANWSNDPAELGRIKQALVRRINNKVKETRVLEEQLAKIDEKIQALLPLPVKFEVDIPPQDDRSVHWTEARKKEGR